MYNVNEGVARSGTVTFTTSGGTGANAEVLLTLSQAGSGTASLALERNEMVFAPSFF